MKICLVTILGISLFGSLAGCGSSDSKDKALETAAPPVTGNPDPASSTPVHRPGTPPPTAGTGVKK